MTAGNVEAGLDWINQHFLGNVSYDHDAGATTRFGPIVAGQKFPSTSTQRIMDCSGLVIRAAVEGGMPRYHEGLPESSGDMDRWADAHPNYLLWSNRGGGKYGTLRDAIAHTPRGAVFGIGGYRNGDAGHTGYLLGPGGETLESSSGLGGCRNGTIFRFSGAHAVSHLYMLPMVYGTQPQPLTAEQLELLKVILRNLDNARKDTPAMPKQITYAGHSHVFMVNPDGRLRHDYYTGSKWARDYPAEVALSSARFQVDQTLDAKTKDTGQSENPIDVYGIGRLGELVHVWWNGTAWNTEVFA